MAQLGAALAWTRAQLLEIVDMAGARMGVAPLDGPLLDQPRQALLQRERAGLAGNRRLLMEMLERVLPDVLTGAVTDHQQLRGWNDAAADARQQRLRHHRRERHRELLPDGVLAFRRERVGD